jgi:hypothetical protein
MGNFVLQIGPCSSLILRISPWGIPILLLFCSTSLFRSYPLLASLFGRYLSLFLCCSFVPLGDGRPAPWRRQERAQAATQLSARESRVRAQAAHASRMVGRRSAAGHGHGSKRAAHAAQTQGGRRWRLGEQPRPGGRARTRGPGAQGRVGFERGAEASGGRPQARWLWRAAQVVRTAAARLGPNGRRRSALAGAGAASAQESRGKQQLGPSGVRPGKASGAG